MIATSSDVDAIGSAVKTFAGVTLSITASSVSLRWSFPNRRSLPP
jgi:hypothetical protein